jgi:hypothetical protein
VRDFHLIKVYEKGSMSITAKIEVDGPQAEVVIEQGDHKVYVYHKNLSEVIGGLWLAGQAFQEFGVK